MTCDGDKKKWEDIWGSWKDGPVYSFLSQKQAISSNFTFHTGNVSGGTLQMRAGAAG